MADIIQLPIDTAANWTLYNPVLAEGMPGFESDTDKFKVGDGLSSWTELNYGAAVDLSSYATTSAVAAGYVPRITSVDNRLTRFDGITGAVQSSGITVDDSDNVSGVLALNTDGVLARYMQVQDSVDALTFNAPSGALAYRVDNKPLMFGIFDRTYLVMGSNGLEIVSSDLSTSAFFINPTTRNIGINQTSPSEKLDIVGNIKATGQLTASGTADFKIKNDAWYVDADNDKKTYYGTNSRTYFASGDGFQFINGDGFLGTNLVTITNTGNLTASGTLRVGGGTVVANILSATATLDFPSIGSNDTETLTITVTGAVAGDSVFLGCPAGLDAGLIFCASVTAADTVTVRMHNSSGGSIDPASATFRATVIRF